MDFKVSDKLMREQSFFKWLAATFLLKNSILKLSRKECIREKKAGKSSGLPGVEPLTSAIPVKRFQQLSWQPNWELVIKLVRNLIPRKDEDEIINIWISNI